MIYETERAVKAEFLAAYRARIQAALKGRSAAAITALLHREGWEGSELTIRRRLDAEREPPFDFVILLARVLEVDPGWLVFGDATSAAPPEWWVSPPVVKPGRGRRLHDEKASKDGVESIQRKRKKK